MKKIAVLLTTVLTAGMLAACGQGKNAETTSAGVSDVKTEADSVPEAKPEKDAITFKLGMVDPDGSNFHKGALAIAEEVNKATGGRITIQVFAGGQLGNERDMYEGAQMGTIDMFTASNAVLTSFIPEMAVLDQPFLFETADEAHRVIDGTVGTLIAEKTEEQKIHTVGWMDVGFRNIFSTRPVTSLEDMKNLKIRTMENDLHIAAFNAMGAIATPMASGDVFTGLQQGTIDAAENLQKIEDFILVATFTVMVLASFAQVVNRNIIHAGVSWLEELARYCMVYMALLATEAGLRDNTQISITAITDKIHGMTGRVVRIISKAVVAIFSGVCFFSSFTILKTQLSSGQVSPGLHLPMAIPYFALTLSFGIITVIQAAALVCLVMEKAAEDQGKEDAS